MKPTPIFLERSAPPADTDLREQLGRSYAAFEQLRKLTSHMTQEWKFYTAKSGWIFKVAKKKRAVFYLTPEKKQFFYGMALNEKERRLLLENDTLPEETRRGLAAAKKQMEGYPLQHIVRSRKDASHLQTMLILLDRI